MDSPRATNGLLAKIGVVWQKLDFWAKIEILGPKKKLTSCWTSCSSHDQKKLFKGKSFLFSEIPARTGSVVILGHFLDGPDGSTKFR